MLTGLIFPRWVLPWSLKQTRLTVLSVYLHGAVLSFWAIFLPGLSIWGRLAWGFFVVLWIGYCSGLSGDTKKQESSSSPPPKEDDKIRLTLIEAEEIKKQAEIKAREIAGEAWKAKENAEHYINTAKAMKNIIEGYGNQYLIPSRSLLDDLADTYGYTQAGEDLKKARIQLR
jgi:hypothetical protein